MGWHHFEDYEKKNPEYKNEARKLLCDALGFEPPIHVSVVSEIGIRAVLNANLPKDELEKSISYHTDLIKKITRKNAPELKHLINDTKE